jgi:hypothetical protein
MHKITLVCSTHREHGLCSAAELLKIILAIRPEVIFEEVRPADYESFHNHGAQWSLEAQAIAMYRQFNSPQQVPVDRYEIRSDLLIRMKADLDKVIDFVGQWSEEYQLLDEEHAKNMAEYGFSYLNSDAFSTREAKMSEIEDIKIKGSGNPDAMRVLEGWRHHNRSREEKMLASIYEYCQAKAFDTAVFLVGAAHRAGIAKEIEKYASTEGHLVNWSFYEGPIT